MSVDFYQENAEDFFRRSVASDMRAEIDRFAALLPAGARVLDAGCGSGRDTRAFRERGFQVTATEAAPALATLARAHSGVDVQVMTFDEMAWTEAFDGIWTCASLLHVPRAQLPGAMRRLRDAIVPGGVWYMSFKHGEGERFANGRHFTDLQEDGARALVADVGGLELIDLRVTVDVRPERSGERWLVLMCRRQAGERAAP